MEKRSFNHQIGTWIDTKQPKQTNPRQTGATIRETASWIWRLHQKGKKRHRGSSASLPTKGRSQSELRTSRSPRRGDPEEWREQRRRWGRRTRRAMWVVVVAAVTRRPVCQRWRADPGGLGFRFREWCAPTFDSGVWHARGEGNPREILFIFS